MRAPGRAPAPPAGWQPGRVRWDLDGDVPPAWGHPAPSPPYDAVVVADLPDAATIVALQHELRPGGALVLATPRRPRRAAKALRPYFEGGVPRPGRRFEPVRARRDGSVVAYRRGPGLALGHFEDIASHYAAEIPPHLVGHYLGRKVAQLEAALAGATPRLGLDIGCGVGLYAHEVATRLGCTVVGTDAALPAVREASRRGTLGLAADATRLPFRDATFDFAYTINVVHHLKRGEQALALREALRVLRPGAPLLVFEINVQNPLFRAYMRHVFPRTRAIDRGDEEFLRPRELAASAPVPVESVAYATFVPDFAPRWSLPVLRPLERLLERAMPRMSIHYTAVLRAP